MRVVLSAPYPRVDAKFVRMHGIMPPLGILYVAATLERDGHTVIIVDAYGNRLDPAAAAEAIIEAKPDVVGLGTSTANYLTTREMAQRLRSRSKAPIVLGGVHGSALPELSLRSGAFDYVIVGEGEVSFSRLLAAIDGGTRPEFPGVAFRDNGNIVVHQPELVDLSTLPPKAWHLVNTDNYYPSPAGRMERAAVSTITARGCTGRCVYCALNNIFKHVVRQDPLENVRHELEHLKAHGKRDINFWDSVFTNNRERAIALCTMLKELGLRWNVSARVDQVDRELLEIMADSGCYLIGYGVESGSQESLARLGRPELDLELVEWAAAETRRAGIKLKTYVMLGFPWEKKTDIEKTFRFAQRLKADYVSFCITKPYPGTDLFKQMDREWTDQDFENYHHYSGSNTICEALSGTELERLSSRMYSQYYFDPRYVWRQVSSIRSAADIKHLWNSFSEVFLGA